MNRRPGVHEHSGMEDGAPWQKEEIRNHKDHRFIPAIRVGPPTLLHLEGAKGPYRKSDSGGWRLRVGGRMGGGGRGWVDDG
jgi:hypothetical protein